jgi:hypothetical protein
LLLDLYSCTIRHPSDIIANWCFEIDPNEPEPDFSDLSEGLTSKAILPTDELMSLFEIVITRHISVKGYPQHPQLDSLVDEEECERQAQNPTIRAHKLLKFASSSELMPHGYWKLTVSNSFYLFPM